jgi:aminoglycoside 3-N-acetyltransferase
LQVLFLQGFAGNIRPYHSPKHLAPQRIATHIVKGPAFEPVGDVERHEWNRSLSERVGEAVSNAMKRPVLEAEVAASRMEIPLDRVVEHAPRDRKLSLGRLDFGPRLSCLFMSAEPVAEYGPIAAGAARGRYLIPVAYSDDVFGYLPTKGMVAEGGYEAEGFFPYFSLEPGFAEDFETIVEKAIKELMEMPGPSASRGSYSILDLEEGIRQLGVTEGDAVLVRGAMGAIGPVDGSKTSAFLTALGNVLGPEGTMLGLAFNDCLTKLWQHGKPVVTQATPPYTGGLVTKMLGLEGAYRSRHPTNSFVAVGPMAEALLGDHDETKPCFHPMEKLVAIGGKMMLVGCVDASPGFSTVHLVQEKLGQSYRNLRARLETAKFEKDGRVHRFWRTDAPGCSKGFRNFYPLYIRDNLLRVSHVGDALSFGIDAKSAFELEYAIMSDNPTFALCDNPDCTHCRGSLLYNLKDVPAYCARKMTRKVASLIKRRI